MLKTIRAMVTNKQAGASVYLGVILMLIAFLVITICINTFQMYSVDVRAQLISDVIADGSAVAGQTPLGFDEVRMTAAAARIFSHNNTFDDITLAYEISAADEIVDGSPTGYKLITVVVSGHSNHYFTAIIDFFNGDDEDAVQSFDVYAKSVVKAKVGNSASSVLQQSYYEGNRHNLPAVDITTTTPGNRITSYSTWLMEYYLCPEFNSIYQPGLSATPKSGHLLLDYLKHMGLYSEPHSAESILTGPGQAAFASYTFNSNASASDIQAKANAGEVMFFVCRNTQTGAAEIYIVVPTKSDIDDGAIAVAYANQETANYKVINLEAFKTTHSDLKFYYHN